MKRIILAISFWLLSLGVSYAQFTSVTATITDSDSQTWNNGKWSATLYNQFPQNQPNINGTPLTSSQLNLSGTLSSDGVLTATMADNSQVSPSGTYWQFVICPNASAQCSTVNSPVNGAAQNLSAALSAGLRQLRFPASPTAYGYLDAEISPIPVPGGQYFNVSSLVNRVWNGTSWQNGGGGGGIPGGITSELQVNDNGSFNGIPISDPCHYAGSDWGAKLAAAETAWASSPVEFIMTTACGTAGSTAVNISHASHTIRVYPGNYTYSNTITISGDKDSWINEPGATIQNTQGGTPTSLLLVTGTNFTIEGTFDGNNKQLEPYASGLVHLQGANNGSLNNLTILNTPQTSDGSSALTIFTSAHIRVNNPNFPQSSNTSVFPSNTATGQTTEDISIVGGSIGGFSAGTLSFGGTLKNVSVTGTHLFAVGTNAVGASCIGMNDAGYSHGNTIDRIVFTGSTCDVIGTSVGTPAGFMVSIPSVTMTNIVISGMAFTSYGQYANDGVWIELGGNSLAFTGNIVTVTVPATLNQSCIVQYGANGVIANNVFKGCEDGTGTGIQLLEQNSNTHTAYNSDNNKITGNIIVPTAGATGTCIFLNAGATGGTMKNTTVNDNTCSGNFGRGFDMLAAATSPDTTAMSVTGYNNHFWGTMTYGISAGTTGTGTKTIALTLGDQDFGPGVGTNFNNFSPSDVTLLPTIQISPPQGITGIALTQTTLTSGSHTLIAADQLVYASGGTTIVLPATCPSVTSMQWYVAYLVNNSTSTPVTLSGHIDNIPALLPPFTTMQVGCVNSGSFWMLGSTANSALLNFAQNLFALNANSPAPTVTASVGTATGSVNDTNMAGIVTVTTLGSNTFTITWATNGSFTGYGHRAVCTLFDETTPANNASISIGASTPTASTFSVVTTGASETFTYTCPVGF